MNDIQVKYVMSEQVTTASPDDPIHEAAERLARNSISGMPVVSGGKVVGMVSENDIIWAVVPKNERDAGMTVLDFMKRSQSRDTEPTQNLTVRDIMSGAVIDISPFASLWKAASLMHRHGVSRLPVTDNDGHLVGIVTRADLVQAIAHADASTFNLGEAIAAPSE
jgi:CBS domain-containing protein